MKLAQRVSRIKPSATLTISAKATALKQQGVQVVNFGAGEPDFNTPQHIAQMAMQSIRQGHTRYTAVGGTDELKDAIRETIEKDYGLSYGRQSVLVSCGGKHALYNLFLSVLDPGDEVLVPSPYWVSYPDMVELAEGVPVVVPCPEEDGFKLRPETLERAITPKTRLLVLNSPSNPTGVHYRPEELKGLAEVLARHENVLVASDDIYYRILFDGRRWANIAMVDEGLRERVFIVNGVSKTYCMTGWRIGYLVGDEAVVKAATKLQSQSTSNPCSIAQRACVAALKGDQTIVEKMVEAFEERCRYVLGRLKKLDGVTCPPPDGAFYLFPNFSAWYGKRAGDRVLENSIQLAEYFMEEAHVALVPGEPFGEDRCIRISCALSMEDLEEGLNRMEEALARLS